MVTHRNGADPHEPGPPSMLDITLAALAGSDRQPAGFRVDESWLATLRPAGSEHVEHIEHIEHIEDAPSTTPIEVVSAPDVPPAESAGRHWQSAPALDIGDAPRFAEAVPVMRHRPRRRDHDRLRALAAALIVCQLAIGVFLGSRPTTDTGTAVPLPALGGTPGNRVAAPVADPGPAPDDGAPPAPPPPLAILPVPVAVTATPTIAPPAAQAAQAPPEEAQLAPQPGPPPGPPPSPERPPPSVQNPPPPPPPPTPTPTPTPPPPAPAKPVVVSQAAGASSIQTRGCPNATTPARAVITSSAPLRAVTLEWVERASRQVHAVPMTQVGDSWVGTIGPAAAPGTIGWRVHARDGQGGTAYGSVQSVRVTSC